jgi:Tol biopolymer transport system component
MRVRVTALGIFLAAVGFQAAAAALPASPQRSSVGKPILGIAVPRDDLDCSVRELKRSSVNGVRVPSPDGRFVAVNREDEQGTAQVYVQAAGSTALVCITCNPPEGAPRRERFKMQPHWHPSGRWILMAVERDEYQTPPVLGASRDYVEGQLQNGLWTNMWAVSPDGRVWHRLTDFRSGVPGVADGYTGPAFTPDGRQAVWSQIMDGNILTYWPFGRWELMLADFEDRDGIPRFRNFRIITPRDMHWNEPGNFAPDGEWLVLSGSVERDAQGMDQYILNIRTSQLVNLTNSPTVWDEHGRFSPDGQKILFMSAYPYRHDPGASQVLTIRTEFMLMNRDGSRLRQLTRFRDPAHPELASGIAASSEWSHDGRSASLRSLVFPNYEDWDIDFRGPCGRRP